MSFTAPRATSTTMGRESLFRPYVYQGTGKDTLTPFMDTGRHRPRGPRTLAPCGTVAAYYRHLRHGQPTDQACRTAYARAKLEQRRRAGR